MKYIKNFSIVCMMALSGLCTPLYGGFFKALFQDEQSAQKVFASENQIQKEVLQHVTADAKQYEQESESFTRALQQQLDDNETQISRTEQELESATQATSKEFLTQKSTILKEIHQLLLSRRITRKEIIIILESHIKLLEGYLRDSQFSSLKLEHKSYYTVEQLEKASKAFFEQEVRLKRLADQKEDMALELETRRRDLASAQKEYDEKRKIQAEFQDKTTVPLDQGVDKGFSVKQRGQLLDLEVQLTLARLELLRMKEKQAKENNNLIATQIIYEKQKLRVLKENFSLVKSKLRVDPADIEAEEQELDKVNQEAGIKRETYFRKVTELTSLREQVKQLLEKEPGAALDVTAQVDWQLNPDSAQSYQHEAYINYLHEQLLYYERKIELLNAQLDLENERKQYQKLVVDTKRSWYDITHSLLRDTETITTEIKRYKDTVAQQDRIVNSLSEKLKAATELLSAQTRSLDTIKEELKKVAGQKDTLFAGNHNLFTQVHSYLVNAYGVLESEVIANRMRIETFSAMIALSERMVKDIKILLEELEVKSIWQRSEYAITREGIANLLPDVKAFLSRTWVSGVHYFQDMNFAKIENWITQRVTHAGTLLFILVFLLGLFLSIILLKRKLLPSMEEFLLSSKPEHHVTFVVNRIVAALMGFLSDHVVGMSLWFVLLLLIQTNMITQTFPRVLFYILSIPYWIYFAHKLIKSVRELNQSKENAIFVPIFEKRFAITFSILAYVAITILFFRQAFITESIRPSQTPRILLAMYSVVARVLIPILLFQAFSIGRKEVVGLLPKRGLFWQFVADKLNRFYYLLLGVIIVLMILSDPYVGGYGNLVSYVLQGIAGTLLLMWGLSVLQGWSKQVSSQLFFISQDDSYKERFPASKTWYGLFTILLFVFLGIIGVVIGLKMWDVTIGYKDVYNLFEYEIFQVVEDGQKYSITLERLAMLAGIIIGGFVLASAVNRFVLRRIFSLIPVDLGVQNTVMSITRYVIILIVFLVAFMWAKLGTMLFTIGFVLFSITYVFKEPLTDFFSYFIILVQRPIQIGDYIEINEELSGVVRRITPRSVILRRKNSYTIIVPNSLIIKDPLSNWNYARNFVAFDDIILTIPYSADPELVRDVISEVLDKSLAVLKSPAPVIRLEEFGEYGFKFMIRGFVTDNNILNKWDIASDVRFSIVSALRKNGIKIAVPVYLALDEQVTKQ